MKFFWFGGGAVDASVRRIEVEDSGESLTCAGGV